MTNSRIDREKRINRAKLVSTVAETLPPSVWNDAPVIRQALNDTADSYRKSGFSVRDYCQIRLVKDVSKRLHARLINTEPRLRTRETTKHE